ncbi:hypothetical protein RGQ29_009729 [Quercus rubra]|uniref:Uncharacterized protein n=1 Tax=Quercus rubra TaxID=3512 RepID=A0AAN7J6G7_QUERU|nr:hypothetical protein RGQ29_009729 [Quercus rubra]
MERTFVLIFFFWAVLTIITPTLIILSENSKPKLDLNGQIDEVIKVRKMMLYIEKYSTKIPIALAPKEAPAPAPAPAPTPISAVPYWD